MYTRLLVLLLGRDVPQLTSGQHNPNSVEACNMALETSLADSAFADGLFLGIGPLGARESALL